MTHPTWKIKQRTPFLKLYTDDWIAGTLDLSFEEKGFYFEILLRMWERKDTVPHDERWIACALGCNPRTVRKLLSALIDAGKLFVEDGRVGNVRMMREISTHLAEDRRHFKPNSERIGAELEPNSTGTAQENTVKSMDDVLLPEARSQKVEVSTPCGSARERESENDRLHRQAYERGLALKGGSVAKSARASARTKGELDGSQGVRLEGGKLTVTNGSAAELAADFPGIDLSAVCNRAGPEIAKMGHPTRDDAMSVLRKWAQIMASDMRPARVDGQPKPPPMRMDFGAARIERSKATLAKLRGEVPA